MPPAHPNAHRSPSLARLPGPVTNRLADKPVLAQVACDALQPALDATLPAGQSAPVSAADIALGRSLWRHEGANVLFAGYQVRPLASVVLERYIGDRPLPLSADGSFLTLEQGIEYPARLDADMAVIIEAIDAAGPFLLQAWCERWVEYWQTPDLTGQSPWAWLASYLRQLTTQAIEESEALAMLSSADTGILRASLNLPLPLIGDRPPAPGLVWLLANDHRPLPKLLIAAGPAWIVYDVETGFRRFDNAVAITQYLGFALPDQASRHASGDLFVTWAMAILDGYLAGQLAKAEQLRASGVDTRDFIAALDAFGPGWVLDAAHRLKRQAAIRHKLPAWLSRASSADRLRYALGLDAVLTARHTLGSNGLLAGIPTPEGYARSRLREQAERDHPGQPLNDPGDVLMSIFSREDDGLLSLAGGGGTIALKEHRISLVALSLLNTGGRPAGWMRVAPQEGKVLPAWLDDDSAMALIKAVDVGASYLRMLHASLLDGEEGAMRRAAFKAMAAAQLPLLALELKLRGQCGFDERGISLVRRGFEPDNALPRPRVARLALEAAPSLPPDIVTGMFVLSQPEADDVLVVYAPLARQPLRQFQDRSQLIKTIIEEPDLYQTVLGWLSDTARPRYANGGLRAPHWLRFGQGDEFAPVPTVTPARVQPVPLQGDPLEGFYDGLVEALTLAADRQTVSNEESFWISAREVGWLVFNQLLPFLSGPAATAGWLIQMGHSLDEHFNEVGGASEPPDISTDELLFDLILALVSETTRRALTGPPAAHAAPVETPQPTAAAAWAPGVLETAWGVPSMSLTPALRDRLEALAVPRPEDLSPTVPSGPLQGLMQDDHRWLAWVEGALFEVAPGDGEAVVLDPRTKEPSGPWLRRDEAGRWRLDLRLRLRGGGPKRRIELQREINRQKRLRASQCLVEIERTYRDVRTAGVESEAAIQQALKNGQSEVANTRRLDDASRVEHAFDACVALREEYETISAAVAVPERGQELSVALAAETNLCGYYLSLNRDLLVGTLDAAQAGTAAWQGGQPMLPADVTRWFAVLHEYRGIVDAGVRWRMRLDERMRKLGEIPGAGTATLCRLAPKMAAFRQLIEYRALSVYTELSLLEQPMAGDDPARRSVHDALKPLVLAMNTHKEITLDASLAGGNALELLDSVVHGYQAAQDTLQWLRQTLRPEYVSPALDRLSTTLEVLQADAEQWLGRLLRDTPAASPTPATPPASGPREGRKVIRTRHRGVVVARVRANPRQPATEVAEITSPLDDRVVARFEQDPLQGDWVEHAPVAAPAHGPAEIDLEQLAEAADRQLEGAQRQLEQAPRLARVTRIPLELEELMCGTARKLTDLADRIERGLTLRNETDVAVEAWGSAERKARALQDMAARLITEGRTLRIRLSKTALPTADRVRYLVQQGAVRVQKLGSRIALKGQGKRKDLIQEYAIAEPNGTVLWYAHFHYASMAAADDQYLVAHLKTASQRFMGLQAQMAQAATDAEVVRIYRSRIDPQAARELFLSQP